MLQEVVFCKTIFDQILRYFQDEEPWDSKTYYNNLKLKKIITFSSNKKVIERGLNKSRGFLKIFGNHIWTADKLDYLIISQPNKFYEDKNINDLLNLAVLTESKILHTELKHFQNLVTGNLPTELEFTNISQFNNPPPLSRLLVANRDIIIAKGKPFRFDNVLLYYFKETTSITFSDLYIRKRKSAYLNLKRFIRMCLNIKDISIYTDTRRTNDCFITEDDLKKDLREEFKVSPKVYPTSQHRRKIKTDKFELKIDPGLDFVNEEYVAEKHDFDIQIRILQN
jgi:hypothetical protein